jgi:hypothetical protein
MYIYLLLCKKVRYSQKYQCIDVVPPMQPRYSGYAGEKDGRLPYLSSLSHSLGIVGWEVKPAEDGTAPNGELRIGLHRRRIGRI